jgi:hypothetical protein
LWQAVKADDRWNPRNREDIDDGRHARNDEALTTAPPEGGTHLN